MTPEQLQALIRRSLPDAEVHAEDLTGTRDHWRLTVISEAFEGERLVAQHRMINEALAAQLKDNTIHALSLKTYTPARWAEAN
ncbi:MAG: hypothetical protein CMH57_09060 [Myxococcales bacterium]|nr:hypothetical protein [Myxococcales bacterium]